MKGAPTVFTLERELEKAQVRLELYESDLTALRQRVPVPPMPQPDREGYEEWRAERALSGREAKEHLEFLELLMEFLKMQCAGIFMFGDLKGNWQGLLGYSCRQKLVGFTRDGYVKLTALGEQTLEKLEANRKSRLAQLGIEDTQ